MYQLVALRPWAIQPSNSASFMWYKEFNSDKAWPYTRAIFQGKPRSKPNHERKSASASIKKTNLQSLAWWLCFKPAKLFHRLTKKANTFEVKFSESSRGIIDQFYHIFQRTMLMFGRFWRRCSHDWLPVNTSRMPQGGYGQFSFYLSPTTFEPSNFVGYTATLSELVHSVTTTKLAIVNVFIQSFCTGWQHTGNWRGICGHDWQQGNDASRSWGGEIERNIRA